MKAASQAHAIRGYFYIGSAALFWGISATLGRAAFTGHLLPGGTSLGAIDPLILSQSRATISLAVLLPILLVRRGATALAVPGRDLVRFFLLGVLGVAASNYLYYLAIQRTNVATAIILQYTAPVWVLLYTVARGAQRPSWRRIAAVCLAVVGCALAVGLVGSGGFRMDPLGVAAALLAAFSFAFYNVGGHSVLARYDRWKVLLWVLVGTSAFWMVVNPPWKIVAAHYGREQWGFMAVFSLVSVLASILLLLRGTAISGADAGHRGQLSGAGIQHCDRGDRVRRVAAFRADPGNRAGAGGDCADPDAGTDDAGRRVGG